MVKRTEFKFVPTDKLCHMHYIFQMRDFECVLEDGHDGTHFGFHPAGVLIWE